MSDFPYSNHSRVSRRHIDEMLGWDAERLVDALAEAVLREGRAGAGLSAGAFALRAVLLHKLAPVTAPPPPVACIDCRDVLHRTERSGVISLDSQGRDVCPVTGGGHVPRGGPLGVPVRK